VAFCHGLVNNVDHKTFVSIPGDEDTGMSSEAMNVVSRSSSVQKYMYTNRERVRGWEEGCGGGGDLGD
jgi:hypothetical protein